MLLFDLEADGLLKDLSVIHCLAIHDTETGVTTTYNNQGSKAPIAKGVRELHEAEAIGGHNIIGYDIPVIKKMYSWFRNPPILIDTLLLSRLIHSDMLSVDKKITPPHMPLKLYGRHSLEAYGYRLREYKGSFCERTDWKEWSPEMEEYMEQDVRVTVKLWNHFHQALFSQNG